MVIENRLEVLTAINLDDLVYSFGCDRRPLLAFLMRRLFLGAARKFARQMLDFDSAIKTNGLAEAACRTERLFACDVRLFNAELLPDGPFLALSNHPGVTDTLALMAALGRPDLKIIALNRPFLLALPNLSRRLYYVNEDPQERFTLVRQVSKTLRDGGSILTFPAGRNEPDPDVYPGAVEALGGWTDSVGVFARLAPATPLVPVCVRNVMWRSAAKFPLSNMRRSSDDKQLLASALQLLASLLFGAHPVTVQVQIGRPITVKNLGSSDTHVLHNSVLAEMKRLIESKPEGLGKSLL